MSDELTTREACRLLGVRPPVDVDDVKRAYREQARRHHPDAGGDPRHFHLLRLAYETLVAEPPARADVSRGRPSRRAPGGSTTSPAAVDLDAAVPVVGERMSRERVAVCIATAGGLVAASRAPGSRLNGVAHHLAGDLAARLLVGPARDDRGRGVLAVDLVAHARRARRTLEGVSVGDDWLRVRGPATTTLRSQIEPVSGNAHAATRAADRVNLLLEDLGWPLETWRLLETGQHPAGAAS